MNARHASVRIIKTPQGEAPLAIRESWVGLELPLAVPGYCRPLDQYHAVSNQEIGEQDLRIGVIIDAEQAIARLKEKDSKAASFWEGVNLTGRDLFFGKDEVEPIGEITMGGNFRRVDPETAQGSFVCGSCGESKREV